MRVINTVMKVILVICLSCLACLWGPRVITLPDANELATKADLRAIRKTVIDRSQMEEKKRRIGAETDKRQHDDLMRKLHTAMVRQQENIRQINRLQERLKRITN